MAKPLVEALVLDIVPSLTDVGMVRPELHLRDINTGDMFTMCANNYQDLNAKYIGLNSVLTIKNERRFSNIVSVINKGVPSITTCPSLCPSCQQPLVLLSKIHCCENLHCLNIRKGVMRRLFKYLRLGHVFNIKLVDKYMDENPDFDYISLLDSRQSTVYQFCTNRLRNDPFVFQKMHTFQDTCISRLTSMEMLLILPIGVSTTYAEKLSEAGKIPFDVIKKYDVSDILCSGIAVMTAHYIKTNINNEISKDIVSRIEELKRYVKGKRQSE